MDEKVQRLISQYLKFELPLEGFQGKFYEIYIESRQRRIPCPLCASVVGPLAEMSRGHLSEGSFREELRRAIDGVDDFDTSSTASNKSLIVPMLPAVSLFSERGSTAITICHPLMLIVGPHVLTDAQATTSVPTLVHAG